MLTRRLSKTGLEVSGLCLGTMYFGTTVAQDRAFALLDRYVEAGGRLLDTANNYAFWVEGGTGNESEQLLGRWLTSRRTRDDVVLATKVGARPRPGSRSLEDVEGLSAAAVREQVQGSLHRLGTDHIDLLYAHIDDATTPLAETLATFDTLVRDGLVSAVACSNLALPRLREAHAISATAGLARYEAMQMRATYLTPSPAADFAPQVPLDDTLARYAAEQDMLVLGYSPLLSGAYGRADRPLPEEYRHPGTDAQLLALQNTADRLGVGVNQVVLAWLMSAPASVVPVLGVSRLDQLEDALAAATLTLDVQAVDGLASARALSTTATPMR